MAEHMVAVAAAIPNGEARGFTVAGREVVLCRVEDEIYALDGICTHEELPLDGGEIDSDGILTCPWHGARYDVRTGRVRALPAIKPLKVFESRVDDEGRVHVTLPD